MSKANVPYADAIASWNRRASRGVGAKRWFLGAQNDGLFIIDTPPRPSNDDQWHDRPGGPELVIPLGSMDRAKAQAIVDAHNSAEGEPVAYLSKCESGVYKGEFEAEAVKPDRPPFSKDWSDWFPVWGNR